MPKKKAQPAYRFRGKGVIREVTRQGQATAAQFAAVLGELQFSPRAAELGVKPFKPPMDPPNELYTVDFGPGVLLYGVDDEARVIHLVQVIWRF